MGSLIMPLVLIGIVLVFGGIFLVTVNKQKKNSSRKEMSKRSGNSTSTSKGTDTSTPREDVFKFMEFDKILDDMIVQENGTKFSMVVQCKGINYDLMSEVEQLAVEEGFITFLNTLRYPIQIYVQAQNIDLKKSIKLYSDRVQNLRDEYDEKNELLAWSITNAKTVSNSYGEIKIDKDRRNKRIDPVDAVINGYKLMFKVEIRRTDINKSAEKFLELFGKERIIG